jgi:hypothetical protein
VIGSPEVRVAGYGGGRSQVSDDGGEDISWVVLCFERAGADLLLMGAVEMSEQMSLHSRAKVRLAGVWRVYGVVGNVSRRGQFMGWHAARRGGCEWQALRFLCWVSVDGGGEPCRVVTVKSDVRQHCSMLLSSRMSW